MEQQDPVKQEKNPASKVETGDLLQRIWRGRVSSDLSLSDIASSKD